MTNKAECPSEAQVREWRGEWSRMSGNLRPCDECNYVARKAIEWALQGAEPVATTLLPDPEDEREGIYFSNADWKRLMALPPHTKLYTSPQAPELPREALTILMNTCERHLLMLEHKIAVNTLTHEIEDCRKALGTVRALLNSAPPTTQSGKP